MRALATKMPRAAAYLLAVTLAGLAVACDDEEASVGERTFSPAALTAAAGVSPISAVATRDATQNAQVQSAVTEGIRSRLSAADAGAVTEVRVDGRRVDLITTLAADATDAGARVCDAGLASSDEVTSIIVWNADGGALARCQRADSAP